MIPWGRQTYDRGVFTTLTYDIFILEMDIYIYTCTCAYTYICPYIHTHIYIYMYKMFLSKETRKRLCLLVVVNHLKVKNDWFSLVSWCQISAPTLNSNTHRFWWRNNEVCLGMEVWGWRMGWWVRGQEWRTCTMGEMTFGDIIKSSFCIKHKLLIQFKKIIFCFLLRLGRKEGWGGE